MNYTYIRFCFSTRNAFCLTIFCSVKKTQTAIFLGLTQLRSTLCEPYSEN